MKRLKKTFLWSDVTEVQLFHQNGPVTAHSLRNHSLPVERPEDVTF